MELSRRQRLSRLLGTDAVLSLEFSDSDPGDLHQLDNDPGPPALDENLNLNHKVGFTVMSRVQDYSTNSLEFSDMESLVSDSADDQGVWNHSKYHSSEEIYREPLAFVEFTNTNDVSEDVTDNRFRYIRQLLYI